MHTLFTEFTQLRKIIQKFQLYKNKPEFSIPMAFAKGVLTVAKNLYHNIT